MVSPRTSGAPLVSVEPATRWLGKSQRRREDDRLVRGQGRFVDDLRCEGCAHLVFVRSPLASAMIEGIDTSAAMDMPGVLAIFVGQDLLGLTGASVNPVVEGMEIKSFEILARDRVTAVGQPLAMIVAETLDQARDAADLIKVDYRDQPVADEAAIIERRHVHGDVEAAFASAAFIAEVTVSHARLAPMSLEPRAALSVYDAGSQALTIHLSTQTPWRAHAELVRILGLDPGRTRVVAPDVGGSFGGKASIYPEEVAVAFASIRTGRPVKWCATRGEEFLSATHGRGASLTGRLALTAEGDIAALDARLDFPLGHWMSYSAAIPGVNAARILPGPYRVGAVRVELGARLSATAPVGIYRGAGRPEAALLMERLMDEAARLTGLDPVALRSRNLVPPTAMPHAMPTGEVIDSGDFPALLRNVVALGAYQDWVLRGKARREAGEIVGLGVAIYVEPCGKGSESAMIWLREDGMIVVATGSTAQGQGRETAFAQIAADAIGLSPAHIVVDHGDTATTLPGVGALASRSTAIGGSAIHLAGRQFRRKLEQAAASLLDCGTEDVRIDQFGCRRRADGAGLVTWGDLATALSRGTLEPGALTVTLDYQAEGEAWASGACLAAVSIDRDTGRVLIETLAWVDDAGPVVNPLLVKGQMIGGMAQGLGEALMERLVYDETGQLITGSLLDYAVPTADDIPDIRMASQETASPMNALGVKGVGEAGCIGVPAAVANAVMDALRPLGVEHLDMPFTGHRVWRAIRDAAAAKEATT